MRFILLLSTLCATTALAQVPELKKAPAAAGPKFALLIHESNAAFAARTDPAAAGAYWKAYADFGDALVKAGVLVEGNALGSPAGGTLVKVRAGKTTREPVGPAGGPRQGGYFIIAVKTLEEAVAWAAKVPAPDGAVEVRPVFERSPAMAKP